MKDIQAFPLVNDIDKIIQGGMSLRDYFAAKALQGIVSNLNDPAYMKCLRETAKEHGLDDGEVVAKLSFELADEMLKQRE